MLSAILPLDRLILSSIPKISESGCAYTILLYNVLQYSTVTISVEE
jgi:hypothetical protein